MIGRQALAIVWAQWRSISNRYSRTGKRRFPIAAVFGILWYSVWAFIAVAVGISVSEPDSIPLLTHAGPTALLMQFVYWQIVPIIMVSSGVSLDLSRLIVYPIPHAQLLTIEVLLRVTTSLEMLLLSGGVALGILFNPQLPWFGVVAVLVFAFFNLLMCAGLKDLLGRLLVRKGFREGMVFVLVIVAALPQLLLVAGAPEGAGAWHDAIVNPVSPWGAVSHLAFGTPSAIAWSALLVWTLGAWLFARNQFERTLRFDTAEAKAQGQSDVRRKQFLDVAVRLLCGVFRDPTAALLEKEIRLLSRSARFRLLFLMGFSFGLLIWLPMALRRDSDSFFRANYLTVVSTYALMLLGEVCFWNNLGLDREAVQAYFAMPVSMASVLRSKNLAAIFFIILELVVVSFFCFLLRMPITLAAFAEAFCVTLVFGVFLMAFGNLISVRYPRAVDPSQSWRSGSVGRAQAYLLLLYPAAAGPIALAFGARFAFDSDLAFYGVLLLDVLIGAVVYTIALESAVKTAEANKESIVLALARSEGPASS